MSLNEQLARNLGLTSATLNKAKSIVDKLQGSGSQVEAGKPIPEFTLRDKATIAYEGLTEIEKHLYIIDEHLFGENGIKNGPVTNPKW